MTTTSKKQNGGESSLLPFNPESLLSKSRSLVGVECVALPTTLSISLSGATGRPVLLYQGKPLFKSRHFKTCLICGTKTGRNALCDACVREVKDIRYRVVCAFCEKEFTRSRYAVEKSLSMGSTELYCSVECSQSHHAVKNHRLCQDCGALTATKTSRYCAECNRRRRENTRVLGNRECPFCGKEFRPTSHKTKYCSNECADFGHSLRMRGKNNSNYKDGQSYAEWFKRMRPLILERDEHKCAVCGAENVRQTVNRQGGVQVRSTLVIHHIDQKPANNVASNLITLCQGCHVTFHKTGTGKSALFPQLQDLASQRSSSMTSKLKEIATSLQMAYSCTTAELLTIP